MATIAWPYNLSHSPPPPSSKIDCSYEQSTLGQNFCAFSISYLLYKYKKIKSHTRTLPAFRTSSSYATIGQQATKYPDSITKQYPYPYQFQLSHSHSTTLLYATYNRPRGFGASPKKMKKSKKSKTGYDNDDDDDDEEKEEAEEEGIIPEIVTNRMISRMGFSVGIPLFIGVLFFPFFYYLKVVQKIDVPSWVPFIVSFIFFGTALLGVSYGIVSSSWDPLREGSLLGWNEAQKNWPVFWQSLWGGSRKK